MPWLSWCEEGRTCESERLWPLQDTTIHFVIELLLHDIEVAVELDIGFITVERHRAEHPGTLVANLGTAAIRPGAIGFGISDGFHLLVAGNIDRAIGVNVVVRRRRNAAGRQVRAGIGHVSVDYRRSAAGIVAMVGAVIGEGAGGAGAIEAGANVLGREDEEFMVQAGSPPIDADRMRHLSLNLRIGEAFFRRDGTGAARGWVGGGVYPGSAEAGFVDYVLACAAHHLIILRIVVIEHAAADIAEPAFDQAVIRRTDCPARRLPEDRIADFLRLHDGAAVIAQFRSTRARLIDRRDMPAYAERMAPIGNVSGGCRGCSADRVHDKHENQGQDRQGAGNGRNTGQQKLAVMFQPDVSPLERWQRAISSTGRLKVEPAPPMPRT